MNNIISYLFCFDSGFLRVVLAISELSTRVVSNSRDPPAYTSQGLGSKVCASTSWLNSLLLKCKLHAAFFFFF